MVEIIFVVDNVTEDTVSLEKGHEANEPQIFKVVFLFRIEVDIHFHGLNSLWNTRFDLGFHLVESAEYRSRWLNLTAGIGRIGILTLIFFVGEIKIFSLSTFWQSLQ